MILLPVIAFILITIISLPPEIALGVMVIAAAPGGVTSNILTKFANGDVALSVTLTAVVSLLSILIVPFIVLKVWLEVPARVLEEQVKTRLSLGDVFK